MCMDKLVQLKEKIIRRRTPEYWWGRAKNQIEGIIDKQNRGQRELEFARRKSIALFSKYDTPEPGPGRKIMIGY